MSDRMPHRSNAAAPSTASAPSAPCRRLPAWPLLAALCAALLWPATLPAQSPTDTTVLRGNEVTPDKLVDLLTPDPPPGLTRGLKVDRENTKPAAVRRPSASLLITFETNSARLTESSKQQLDTVANALKSDRLQPFTFNLEGHADRRGSPLTNRSLSQSRAESVRDYLVTTHGIAPGRLAPVGKGDVEPLNTQDIAAPENRRVTIVTRAE